jgi:CheY-like chemotaxis protein
MRRARALSVLVVDDYPDAAETLAVLLRLYGHVPVIARCGCEAVHVACRRRPDVVLLDIGLPDVDGFEVARLLRAGCGSRMLLIAVTGRHNPEERYREAGFDHHFLKPFEPADLRTILETHVARMAEECVAVEQV